MRHESDYGPDGPIGLLMTFGTVAVIGFVAAAVYVLFIAFGIH